MPADSNGSGFLAEVLADPDNDVPRLIYADWLEEQGSARGEFIRLQCELHTIDSRHPQWLDLKYRSEELLKAHGQEWADELQQDVRKCEYQRGFIDTVTVLARTLLKNGESLLTSFPVRWIRLNYMKGTAARWADCTALQHVRFLDLSYLKIGEDDLLGFLQSPHLKSLQGLKIGGAEQPQSERVAQAVCQPGIAANLEHLEIEGYDGAVERILSQATRLGGFPRLKHLRLTPGYGDRYEDLGTVTTSPLESLVIAGSLNVANCEALSRIPLQQLRKLTLNSFPLSGLKKLAEAGALESLEELTLGDPESTARSAKELFFHKRLQHCRMLDLSFHNHMFARADMGEFISLMARHTPLQNLTTLRLRSLQPGYLAKLATSPNLANVEDLSVLQSSISEDDLMALRSGPWRESLRRLEFVRMGLPAKTIRQFSKGVFPNLVHFALNSQFDFEVDRSGVEDAVLELLMLNAMPNLQSLHLVSLGLTEDTLKVIAGSDNCRELRVLNFDENRGSNDAMVAVLESPNLPHLHRFSLKDCKGLRRSEKFVEKYGDRLRY